MRVDWLAELRMAVDNVDPAALTAQDRAALLALFEAALDARTTGGGGRCSRPA